MSAIDQYKYELLGYIECDSEYGIVCDDISKKHIGLYRLLENIPNEEDDFDGNVGDILLGGGSGEAPAIRLSMPGCLDFWFDDNWDGNDDLNNLVRAFWTPTQAFKLCNGFLKYGWSPDRDIESWLAENICSLLVEKLKYSDKLILTEKTKLIFIPA